MPSVDRYVITDPAIEHNRSTYDNKGCRCDTCRAANTKYQRDMRARAAQREPASHGLSGYRNGGCRCAECRKANTDAVRKARADRAGTKPVAHGTSAYQNYGCRCGTCREAIRVKRADDRTRVQERAGRVRG